MRIFKKILINLLAGVLLVASCFSLVGCKEDITQINVNIRVYNFAEETEEQPGFEDLTIKVDLYGHFAPNTVDAIISYVKQGYYNNTAFYKIDSSFPNQIMLGDFLADGSGVKGQEKIMPQIKGEFEHGGTVGSNLKAKKGTIGLWRTWYEFDGSYDASNQTMNSGRATWFLPSNEMEATLAGYNGWFCMFAQIDMEKDSNARAFSLVENTLTASHINKFVVYYTGAYDAEKVNENHGLTQHIVPADEFNLAEVDGIFEAKGNQEVCYNRYTINVPVVEIDGQTQIAAKVTSVTLA